MPRNITVTFDDGSTHVYQNAPDSVTPEQVAERAEKEFGRAVSSLDGGRKSGGVAQQVGNVAAGLVRGAGSIGATIVGLRDKAEQAVADAMGAKGYVAGRPDRRKEMDEALAGMGAQPDSFAYGAGKLASEVAGTLGVGGAVAGTISRAAPGVAAAAPNVVNAIRTGGMSGGGLAARTLGGAVTGGVASGVVDPEQAGIGALIGGVMPGAVKLAGVAGHGVGAAYKSMRGGATPAMLAKALEIKSPAQANALAAELEASKALVPGSLPTVAQILRTPQAGILERVVGDSAGGASLKERYASQALARLKALEGVAPVNPTGFASARDDLGRAVSDYASGARGAARAKTSELYGRVPQDEAVLYLPDLASIRDKYFGAGVFGGREAVDQAVSTARSIGIDNAPGIVPKRAPTAAPKSIAQEIRRMGGLSIKDNDGLRGEIAALGGDFKNLVRVSGGVSPARAAEALKEAGYIADESADALFDALRSEAIGKKVYSVGNSPEAAWAAARESAMGEAPAGGEVAKKVTLKEFENLRRSIGAAERAAARDPARATEARALADMKRALDDRINSVVSGDGAADEVLPLAWADDLSAARKAKADEVKRFATGPQERMWHRGADGAPVMQGGEVMAAFWGNRPGVADDVASFRRLIADNPKLLSQFRSMVTTEAASTANAGGNLGAKFARWVDNQLPGLKQAFSEDEVKMLRRIAQDVRRAEAGASAGLARGSNTYQNASNALSLGFLDSPLLNAAANRIPVVNTVTGPTLQWVREGAREARAREFAALLADPNAAANALRNTLPMSNNALANALADPRLIQQAYRVAPVLATSR